MFFCYLHLTKDYERGIYETQNFINFLTNMQNKRYNYGSKDFIMANNAKVSFIIEYYTILLFITMLIYTIVIYDHFSWDS